MMNPHTPREAAPADISDSSVPSGRGAAETPRHFYRIRFREGVRECTAWAAPPEPAVPPPGADDAPPPSPTPGFARDDLVMVRLERGTEPAVVRGRLHAQPLPAGYPDLEILRRASIEERARLDEILALEREAHAYCKDQVNFLGLVMSLVRVERHFDGSKMIFYFTAENRVDFRELVKILVRQYRTRIEMRQIGVRHETQMLGGLGICGRELCCSAFLNNFDGVSIKMAKAQDLPLNPGKISGNCNRLLCCLTYEYEMYRDARKHMPRPGKTLYMGRTPWQVIHQYPLTGRLTLAGPDGTRKTVGEEEWGQAGDHPVEEAPVLAEDAALSPANATPPPAPSKPKKAHPAPRPAPDDAPDSPEEAPSAAPNTPNPPGAGKRSRRKKRGKKA